jgi:antitoxin CptB
MNRNRLFWACRRGMLELDLILLPFLEKTYPHLDREAKRQFECLLDSEDQELFAWFLRREDPEDPDKLNIVQIIRESREKLR